MIAMRKLWGSGAIAALVAIALPSVASAQSAPPPFDPAIDINNFEYSIGPKSFFTVDKADTADQKQLALDAVVTFLSRPFTVYTTDGDPNNPMITGERTQVVQSLTAAQLSALVNVLRALAL